MKQLLLFFSVFILHSSVVSAQDEFYLKLDAGVGGSRLRSWNTIDDANKLSETTPVYRGAVTGGYKFGPWSVEAGVGFGRTGGRYEHGANLLFEEDFDSSGSPTIITPPTDFSSTFLFAHILLPVSVGYSIPISQRFELQPRLGVEAAYNAWASRRMKMDGVQRENVRLSNTEFDASFTRFTLFGTAALQLHYNASAPVGFFAGISYRRTITNLMNTDAPLISPNTTASTFSITADAGVRFTF